MRSSNRAFTLIELLVVIAIISILAAILFPVLARATEQARIASCSSNMHQIFSAMSMYTDDWNGFTPNSYPINFYKGRTTIGEAPSTQYVNGWTHLPPTYPIQTLLMRYTSGNRQVMRCPSDSVVPSAFNGRIIYPPDKWVEWFNDENRDPNREPSTPPGFDRRIVMCTYPQYGTSYQWRLGRDNPYEGNTSPDGKRATDLISARSMGSFIRPSKIGAARDAQPRHMFNRSHTRMDWRDPNQGGNVMYLDGHVKFTLGTEFLAGIF